MAGSSHLRGSPCTGHAIFVFGDPSSAAPPQDDGVRGTDLRMAGSLFMSGRAEEKILRHSRLLGMTSPVPDYLDRRHPSALA